MYLLPVIRRSQIVMVTEYIKGVSLKAYATGKKLGEREVAHVFRQIVSAVAYCHSKGISHRDLKLENILVTGSGTAKIIDFGFSVWTPHGQKVKILCGTPAYMSPEIIKRYEYDPQLADVWATGVVLYYLLCGGLPFSGGSAEEVGKDIAVKKDALLQFPGQVSEVARDLIRGMLCRNPEQRFSAFNVLQHPFLVWGGPAAAGAK